MHSSLLLGLATREEGNARHGGGNGARESGDGGLGDLLRGGALGAGSTRGDHVRLEESTLEDDVLVVESLVASSDNLLGDDAADLDIVVTIHEDLGLDDGDETVHLGDGGVLGEVEGVLGDGSRGRSRVGDAEDSAPLGETGASSVVLLAALIEVGDTLGVGLLVAEGDVLGTLVGLDTKDDVLLLKELNEGLASLLIGLEEGLLEENNTRDVLLELCCGK